MYDEGSLIAAETWAVGARERLAQLAIPNRIIQVRVEANPTFAWQAWAPHKCGDCEEALLSIEAEKRAFEAREVTRQTRLRLERSGLPYEYVTGQRGLDDLVKLPNANTPQFVRARTIVANLLAGNLALPWFYICGENGLGKTSLACVALQIKIQNGGRGCFIYFPSFVKKWQAAHAPGSKVSAWDLEQEVIEAPHLVLDELGT
ncbi:MAG TPA: hypothetical protein VK504_09415, partial [Vicinamibacterales bacterium]|nr:hypothetical protein [Vicinamibacterales bacterium]